MNTTHNITEQDGKREAEVFLNGDIMARRVFDTPQQAYRWAVAEEEKVKDHANFLYA